MALKTLDLMVPRLITKSKRKEEKGDDKTNVHPWKESCCDSRI
jgi:hypothetical protein